MTKQQAILSQLLDRYENSQHLLDPGSSRRRVMLRIDRNDLPQYRYDQSAEIRDDWNSAASDLEKQKLIAVEWGRPKLMSAIVLDLDNVEDAYRLCARMHPGSRATSFVQMIEANLQSASCSWILGWKTDVCEKALKAYKLPGFCQKDFSLLEKLLRAFSVYDGLNGSPITQRAFSIACYKNSKVFEREIRDEFLRVACRYNKELSQICEQQDLSAREKLAFLGIYVRPELFELSGNCSIITKNGTIDISALGASGIAVPSTAADIILGFELNRIRIITFIENKTNYDEYLINEKEDDELVLYHGGILSPQRARFFQKLSESLSENIQVRLWSDIDLGGLMMFKRLQQFFSSLEPMRMSSTDVKTFHDLGLVRGKDYLDKLNSALVNSQFPEFTKTIEKLLEYGVTIEQEVFLM